MEPSERIDSIRHGSARCNRPDRLLDPTAEARLVHSEQTRAKFATSAVFKQQSFVLLRLRECLKEYGVNKSSAKSFSCNYYFSSTMKRFALTSPSKGGTRWRTCRDIYRFECTSTMRQVRKNRFSISPTQFTFLWASQAHSALSSFSISSPLLSISERFNETIYDYIPTYLLNICEVCGSSQCPYCAIYNAAVKSPIPIILIISMNFVLLLRYFRTSRSDADTRWFILSWLN